MEMMVALRNITLIFKTEEPTGMKYLFETQKIKNMFIPVVSDLMGQQISQKFSTSYFVGSLKTLRSFDNLKDWANRNKIVTWEKKRKKKIIPVGNRNENCIWMKNMLFLVSIEPEIHTEENCISYDIF